MTEKAFLIAGDRAAAIANDTIDTRYRAAVHYVPVGVQVPVRSHDETEMQFMLEDGTLEFMIGGASAYLSAPNFVRVPAGVPYAYRNVGEHTARLLAHAARPEPAPKIVRATIEYAA